MLTIALQT